MQGYPKYVWLRDFHLILSFLSNFWGGMICPR